MNHHGLEITGAALVLLSFVFLLAMVCLYERNRFYQCPKCRRLFNAAGGQMHPIDRGFGYMDGQCRFAFCPDCTKNNRSLVWPALDEGGEAGA